MLLHHSFPVVLNDLNDSVAAAVADDCHDSYIDVSRLHFDIIEVCGWVAMTMVMMIILMENVVYLIGCCYC